MNGLAPVVFCFVVCVYRYLYVEFFLPNLSFVLSVTAIESQTYDSITQLWSGEGGKEQREGGDGLGQLNCIRLTNMLLQLYRTEPNRWKKVYAKIESVKCQSVVQASRQCRSKG